MKTIIFFLVVSIFVSSSVFASQPSKTKEPIKFAAGSIYSFYKGFEQISKQCKKHFPVKHEGITEAFEVWKSNNEEILALSQQLIRDYLHSQDGVKLYSDFEVDFKDNFEGKLKANRKNVIQRCSYQEQSMRNGGLSIKELSPEDYRIVLSSKGK